MDYSHRTFALWAYSVSHASLLLRSVKGDFDASRIDILFTNVGRLDLPTTLTGVKITRSCADGQATFTVEGDGYSGYVVAGSVASQEDDGEYHEPSRLWPAHTS